MTRHSVDAAVMQAYQNKYKNEKICWALKKCITFVNCITEVASSNV